MNKREKTAKFNFFLEFNFAKKNLSYSYYGFVLFTLVLKTKKNLNSGIYYK